MVQNCQWCGEGTWNGETCGTCGATSDIGTERPRCDACNVRHDESERETCEDCGDGFCSPECLADHRREWHAGPRTDVR